MGPTAFGRHRVQPDAYRGWLPIRLVAFDPREAGGIDGSSTDRITLVGRAAGHEGDTSWPGRGQPCVSHRAPRLSPFRPRTWPPRLMQRLASGRGQGHRLYWLAGSARRLLGRAWSATRARAVSRSRGPRPATGRPPLGRPRGVSLLSRRSQVACPPRQPYS